MRGFYEESPAVKKRRLDREKAMEKAMTNPYNVVIGQVYRTWDPRQRGMADSQVTRYKVVAIGATFATLDCVLPPVSPGAPTRSRRSSIRLDRFGPKNYKLLKDVP